MHCTQCGAEGHGRFCANCGAPLEPVQCRSCGAELPAGTRFCTQCGSPTAAGVAGVPAGRGAGRAPRSASEGGGAGAGAATATQGQNAGWWVAGGLFAVVLVIGGIVVFGGPEQSSPPTGAAAPFAGGASGASGTPGTPPDLSTMTPREAADRLFDRVMQAAANEDTAQANQFLPMALDAYELAGPLDDDGLFHVSLLQRAAGDVEESLATARQGLESSPDHLLNLYSAAEAAIQLGDPAAGRDYYERALEVWDEELAADRPEYEIHVELLPVIRQEAEAFLSGGDGP